MTKTKAPMKRILFAVSFICGASVVSAAGPGESALLVLNSTQLDRVTAGNVTVGVAAGAGAASEFFALTRTDTNAVVHATSINGQPHNSAEVGVAGGQATAIAVGPGAATGTAVNETVAADGPNTSTFAVNGGIKVLFLDTTTSTTAVVSKPHNGLLR